MVVIIPNKRYEYENLCTTFPYRLDDFQMNGIYGFENGCHVLVTAHTSAGKSTLAEYGIAKAISEGKRAIYTSPIKTLSNQKYADMKNRFENVGILTGDIKLNPDADCIIMTTEILRNKLDNESDFFENVSCVVFDEVHYFNDPERGFVWEESITKMPDNIQMIMLSATISKAEEFAQWITDIKKRDIYLVSTDYRPVPLNHFIYYDEDINLMMDAKKINQKTIDEAVYFYDRKNRKQMSPGNLLNNLITFLKKQSLFPAIFFSFSRKKCEKYASQIGESLLTQDEQKEVSKIIYKIFASNLKIYENLTSTIEIVQLLKKGIAYHHSGLLPIQKEMIEILFGKGLIKTLFATETFAVGVNMPAKSVIFTELSKFDGRSDFPRILRADEYLQMSGRAGRRGKDKKGYVIVCPLREMEAKYDVISLLSGKPLHLVSQFNPSNNSLLRIMSKKSNMVEFLSNSLFGQEIDKIKKDILEEMSKINLKSEKNVFVSDDEREKVERVLELESKIEEKFYSRKQQQKMKKELCELKLEFSKNMELYLESVESQNRKESEYNYLKNNYEKCEEDILNIVKTTQNMYKDLGLLNEMKDGELQLSTYGKIVSQLTNCNEILLGRLVSNGWFNDLSAKEIGLLLALFVEEREEEYLEEEYLEVLSAPLKSMVLDIYKENKEIDEIFEGYNLDRKERLTIKFLHPMKMWLEEEEIGKIIAVYGNYDGNFVKNIYKIRDICHELGNVCETFQLGGLNEKINELEGMCIRGITEFNSLYIHHYQLVKSL